MKKLYELERNTKIDVTHLGLTYLSDGKILTELTFHRIDGMYSYCTDEKGNVIHLKANTEVNAL